MWKDTSTPLRSAQYDNPDDRQQKSDGRQLNTYLPSVI